MALAKWLFPPQIFVTESANELVIKLTEPLSEIVTGIITWTDPQRKTTTLPLNKQKTRNEFHIKIPADRTASLTAPVHVSLPYEDLTETWMIPVKERAESK